MGVWQIIYLSLTFMGLGLCLAKNGQPKEGTYNFWSQLIADLIILFILCKGGFF